MKNISLVFLFVFGLQSKSSWASFAVGNGGDVVNCRPQQGQVFNGNYSLDYLLTYNLSNSYRTVQIRSLKHSIERLAGLIKAKIPFYYENFAEFMRNYKNTSNFSEKYQWEAAPFGLFNVEDERIVSLIPPNCLQGNKIQVMQAIVRQIRTVQNSTKVIFKYDPRVIDSIESAAPLQMSYLLLHEWLWNFTTDVENLRKANWFFHSDAIEKLSPQQLIAQLQGLGLFIPPSGGISSQQISCKADPFGLTVMHKMSQAQPGRKVVLGRFEVFEIQKFCNNFLGCGDPQIRQDSSFITKYFGNQKVIRFSSLSSQKVELYVESYFGLSARGIVQHTNCLLDLTGAKVVCSEPFQLIDGSTASMLFQGVMNRSCLSLNFFIKQPSTWRHGKEYWVEQEYVLFSRFRLDER